MTTLKFDLKASFGHMRRLEGTTVRQTHKCPPKTTIIGMLAAVIGRDRNSYYDDYNDWKVSVVPHNIRTINIPTLFLSTNDEVETISANGVKIGKGVSSNTSQKNRQRIPVEYLVNPNYTIYVKSNETEDVLRSLQDRIESNNYHYTPTLGISECICSLENPDIVQVSSESSNTVDSVVPESEGDVVPKEGNSICFERVAEGFASTTNNRKPTGFTSVTIDKNCRQLKVKSSNIQEVENSGHRVLFY